GEGDGARRGRVVDQAPERGLGCQWRWVGQGAGVHVEADDEVAAGGAVAGGGGAGGLAVEGGAGGVGGVGAALGAGGERARVVVVRQAGGVGERQDGACTVEREAGGRIVHCPEVAAQREVVGREVADLHALAEGDRVGQRAGRQHRVGRDRRGRDARGHAVD